MTTLIALHSSATLTVLGVFTVGALALLGMYGLISSFKAYPPSDGVVRYSQFGAKGDGETDDIDAIGKAHQFANEHGLPVQAEAGATYYISGKDRTVEIQTDTDFGTSSFIIDDTDVENRRSNVFRVGPRLHSLQLKGVESLAKNQESINAALPGPCLITVTDSNVKRYIRFGPNQDAGMDQTDVFIVDKNGKVDMNAPIIWDFDQITDITAHPIDETTLTITGGRFTTIANAEESRYSYYGRGILIGRSNVVLDGLEHRVTGEGEQGAPYFGFLHIQDCANITVKNTILTGRKTYRTIGSAGVPVSMGSYDLNVTRAVNVSFVNCSQTNDINDRIYWGIMGSNHSKNMLYENCSLSRFDAHRGVANATIRNSSLGHMGINAIGSGTFTIENTRGYASTFINLRSDYGSTWQGDLIIRDCVFVPSGGRPVDRVNLINGRYTGQHDFGYTCYMPKRITIETLHIDDSRHSGNYRGPAIFADFNPALIDVSYEEKFPYVITDEVLLKDISTASGKPLRISDNPFMFREVNVTIIDDAAEGIFNP